MLNNATKKMQAYFKTKGELSKTQPHSIAPTKVIIDEKKMLLYNFSYERSK
jgi:hypothetical protein